MKWIEKTVKSKEGPDFFCARNVKNYFDIYIIPGFSE